MIEIYTDGSCRNNGMPNAVGAWAFGIVDATGKDFVDVPCGEIVRNTTNQRMELMAIRKACDYIITKASPTDEIHIYTDSAYFHNCVILKWYKAWLANDWKNSKKQPVANRDLWESLIPFFSDSRFIFHKVPGHSTNLLNNKIDARVQSMTKLALEHIDD